jgi:O-antigen/teichoic acid export membrane protein
MTGRHTVYNLFGLGAPLLVAVLAVPPLMHALGTARFGLLTLIWAVVSYLGLFDFGLGRALTQRLAMIRAQENFAAVPSLIATATVLMLVLGVVAGVVLAATAPWGLRHIQNVPDQHEAAAAALALAFAMPAIILTTGFRGILEANGSFGVINLIRVPMGLFTFLGPLIVVLAIAPRLDLVAWVLTIGRTIACLAHAWFALRSIDRGAGRFAVTREHIRPLCTTGGWMTLSNIVSPFMGYVDRFMIGTLVSAAAVSYYSTPNELVLKLWIIPGALTSVLFPALAQQVVQQPDLAWQMLRRAVLWLFVAILPLALMLALFSREILALWISPQFAAQSASVLRVFAIGILINCVAQVPFVFIQAFNRPRLVAILHTIELPFFLVALWAGISHFGIIGAAWAWLARIVLDAVALFVIAARVGRRPMSEFMAPQLVAATAAAAAAFVFAVSTSWPLRALVLAGSTWPLVVHGHAYWRRYGWSLLPARLRRRPA